MGSPFGGDAEDVFRDGLGSRRLMADTGRVDPSLVFRPAAYDLLLTNNRRIKSSTQFRYESRLRGARRRI
jgi:hypothetical protein